LIEGPNKSNVVISCTDRNTDFVQHLRRLYYARIEVKKIEKKPTALCTENWRQRTPELNEERSKSKSNSTNTCRILASVWAQFY